MRYATVTNPNIPTKKVDVAFYYPNKGDVLCCADFNCKAKLKYVPKTRVHGAYNRPAFFSSISRGDHIDECIELSYENDSHDNSLSLKQAVLKNRVIILSLNRMFGLPSDLWQSFGNEHDGRKLKNELNALKERSKHVLTGDKGHSSHSVTSIKDLISAFATIERHGGEVAIQNLYITWQNRVLSYADFYLNNEETQKQIFKKIYSRSKVQSDFYCSVNNIEESAYGFPRLIRIKPSQRTRKDPMIGNIQSTRLIAAVHERTNSPLILQHQVDMHGAEEAIHRDLFSGDVFILATPRVISSRVLRAFLKFNLGHNGSTFAYMNWTVTGNHQIIAAKGIETVKPYRGDQPKFI